MRYDIATADDPSSSHASDGSPHDEGSAISGGGGDETTDAEDECCGQEYVFPVEVPVDLAPEAGEAADGQEV